MPIAKHRILLRFAAALLAASGLGAADWSVRIPAWAGAEADERAFAAVSGDEVVLGRPRSDSVVALDVMTGAVRWSFALRGPLSATPIAHAGGWILASDAGDLTSVQQGRERWRRVLAPGRQQVINAHLDRVVSAWPVRSGPLLEAGVVYAGVGIHPVMGFSCAAVEADTGVLRWTTDLAPATTKQPHGTTVLDSPVLIGGMQMMDGQLRFLGGRAMSWAVDPATGLPVKPSAVLKYAPGKDGTRIPSEVLTRSWFGLGGSKPPVLAVPGGGIFLRGSDQVIRAVDAEAADRLSGPAASGTIQPGGLRVLVGQLPVAEVLDLARSGGRWIAVLPESEAAVVRGAALAAGLLGHRLSVPGSDVADAGLPAMCAEQVVIADRLDGARLAVVMSWVRPFGGRVQLRGAGVAVAEHLLRFGLTADPAGGAWIRAAAPTGSAPWGNPYGTAANTYVIPDQLARAPLGLAWIGGEADGRGDGPGAASIHVGEFQGRTCPAKDFPPVLVAGGRMLVHSKRGKLLAFDAYSGRMLWSATAGETCCADASAVYAWDGTTLVRLDARTGRTTSTVALPVQQDQAVVRDLRLVGDRLIAATGREITCFQAGDLAIRWRRKMAGLGGGITVKRWYYHPADFAIAADEQRVVAVRVVDPSELRPGESVGAGAHALSLDLHDGRIRWASPVSLGKDLLSVQIDAIAGMAILGQRGDDHGWSSTTKMPLTGLELATGAQRWRMSDAYAAPLTIRAGVGRDHRQSRPIDLRTGTVQGDALSRQYGCAYAIGSASASFMRSGSIAYTDLAGGGLIAVGGMRGGCTPDLVPGDGVVVRPNLALGCLCQYPLFTSLGLQRRSGAMAWGGGMSLGTATGSTARIGWNLGAPGLRSSGITVWRPDIAGASVTGGTPFFRLPARVADGPSHAWVACCGIDGLTAATLPLGPGTWTVRLTAADPTGVGRSFQVRIGGTTHAFTVPSGFAPVVLDLTATGTLKLEFIPGSAPAVLCGIEAIAQPGRPDPVEQFVP